MLLVFNKYQKQISCLLLLIFSLDFIIPNVVAAANSRTYSFNYSTTRNTYDFKWINKESGTIPISLSNSSDPGKVGIKNEILEKNNGERITGEKDGDIDGPGQPEMKSFQSVNANNMVDLFTGDFSYNIPLLDVGGYPVNLHYSSGITMDQEASWVGLGWNINPGSISRSMRGLPDDFDGNE